MFKPNRLIVAAAAIGALAAAGPVASASAAQPAAVVSSGTTAGTSPGSSIPCYPFPAFCDPTTDKPASWAPSWVWPALGLQAPQGLSPITFPPITFPPLSAQPIVLGPTKGA